MTLQERRAAVRAALIADPTQPNTRIAREVGCCRMMVGRMRCAMIERREIDNAPVLAANGKVVHYRRAPLPDHANLTIGRIRRLIDRVAGPKFAATWNNTTPGTQGRLIDTLDRLYRVIHNLKARVRKSRPEPGPGPSRAKTYRHPDPRRTA
jgi:hypothetical protein